MEHESDNHNYFGRPVISSIATSSNPTPLRPGTPNTDNERNLFDNYNDGASSQPPAPSTNPFASPSASRPPSSIGTSSGVHSANAGPRYFLSRRVRKGEIEKPWVGKPDPKEKWVTILPLIGIGLGLCLAGFLVYDGLSSVVHHKYCPVLDDTFSEGFNTNIWTKEVQVGGFGYAHLPSNSSSTPETVILTVITETASSRRPPAATRTSSSTAATWSSRPPSRTRR